MTDVNLGPAQPGPKPKKAKGAKQPTRRSPQSAQVSYEEPEEATEYGTARADAAEPVDSRGFAEGLSGVPVDTAVANPYAPTGWRRKEKVLFDVETPSGQTCEVMRLERDDLMRLDLLQYLDTFTPLLLEDSLSEDERSAQMTEIVKDNPESLQKMFKAIDKVILACVTKPHITEEHSKVNYGSERDWGNPNFVATVHLDDIDTFDRMYIFGAAFGRDMDDLKSVLQQAQGVGSLAN